MTAAERLTLIQVKIERAKEHIATLHKVIQGFFDSKPYQVSTKRDASRRLVYYLSKVQPTPICIAVIAGDAIQNLRTALDHMAWQLFLIGTGGAISNKHIYFPIADDATAYNSRLEKLRQKGVRTDAIRALNAIQPYKGGKDEKLWVLNELNNRDKHRLLVTVGSSYQSMNIGAYARKMLINATGGQFPIPKIDDYLRPNENLFPLKVGDKLFIDAVDAQENSELDFRFNVVLNEPRVIEGAPLIDTLNNFSYIVNKTVLLFEPCLT
ncbi:MAG TPA: hypothetical protein VK487_00365 [Candidatus Bathyarchaeia archaeon]|nr:hypothetical protein [Candidatus Bathyarchaeia archaeon]